jgi:hypothetical protein
MQSTPTSATARTRGNLLQEKGGLEMCLDCGCGELNESHGDARHITMDTIRAAADASEVSVDEAMKNISDGMKQAQAGEGQDRA